jgi:exonuclease VII large subunit
MSQDLSLKELKARFTELTRLPARKAFVVVAAPKMVGYAMRSKEDWSTAISMIEFSLKSNSSNGNDDSQQELDELRSRLDDMVSKLEFQSEQISQLEFELAEKSSKIAELEKECTQLKPETESAQEAEDEMYLVKYLLNVPDLEAEKVFYALMPPDSEGSQKVYRKLARVLHPDTKKLDEKSSARLFNAATNAYERLKSFLSYEKGMTDEEFEEYYNNIEVNDDCEF